MLAASSREHIANAGRLGSGPSLGPQFQWAHMNACGFTMMSMLFILVALAALGAALASLSQRQQMGSAGELAAAKAYQAAFAGLESGSYEILRAAGQPACFATRSFTLPDKLADFTVTLTCTRTPSSGTVSDDGQTLAFYTLVATACNIAASGACPNAGTAEQTYAERQLSRSLSK
ncbi:agglutinin biogenesis protein MshP [Roseateles sp.]|uniref:agglutinin biogenesis protein MshP n=1 Tax=Roseateles sp. TaxID=1971397 RepID=UPI003265AFDE